jgi:hypothetical protein
MKSQTHTNVEKNVPKFRKFTANLSIKCQMLVRGLPDLLRRQISATLKKNANVGRIGTLFDRETDLLIGEYLEIFDGF